MSGAALLMFNSSPVSGGLLITLTETDVSGTGYGYGSVVSYPSVFCNVAGGIAPFTYSWVKTSGSAGTQATSPASVSTTFREVLNEGDVKNSTWHCHVVDSVGTSGDSGDVDVALSAFPDFTSGLYF